MALPETRALPRIQRDARMTRGKLAGPPVDFHAAPASSLPGPIAMAGPSLDHLGHTAFVDEQVRFLMNRATNGFNVRDYRRALNMGYQEWLEWQLDHENIDDSDVDAALAVYPTLDMTNAVLYETYIDDPASVVYELQEALLIRAIYSRRQLYERMVEFWTDHFNINQLDDLCLWFKTTDDRRVIRQHALGTFPDMLRTSPRSAAMLWYLDNYNNIAGNVQENYARELLELHTLGVDGPYTEVDVVEVARAFTGWTFHGVYTAGPFGKFVFVPSIHDVGEKTVLGQTIPAGGGIEDGQQVLDILAMHPTTAEFISRKMARWLLTYEPPQDLVDRLVTIYLSTAGSIKPMIREILRPSTVASIPQGARPKLKRPYHMVTALMRAAEVPTTAPLNLTAELVGLGQVPYWWGTPDGYPDNLASWGKALLPRWEFASRLFAREIPGNLPEVSVLQTLIATAPAGSSTAQAINWVLTGGTIPASHVAGVQQFIDAHPSQPSIVLREAFALMASSPSYQYY